MIGIDTCTDIFSPRSKGLFQEFTLLHQAGRPEGSYNTLKKLLPTTRIHHHPAYNPAVFQLDHNRVHARNISDAQAMRFGIARGQPLLRGERTKCVEDLDRSRFAGVDVQIIYTSRHMRPESAIEQCGLAYVHVTTDLAHTRHLVPNHPCNLKSASKLLRLSSMLNSLIGQSSTYRDVHKN